MALNVYKKRGQLYADSREVAAMVGKSHFHLLRDIDRYCNVLTESKIGCSDFFKANTYTDSTGRKLPRFDCTKMGCEMIAHKLTGEKGILFTATYVKQFHEMERALVERQSGDWQEARLESKLTRRSETDAIKAFIEYAKAHGSKSAERYYIHFTKLANEAVGVTDRETLSAPKLFDLRVAEQLISNAILTVLEKGTEYHQAFQNVKNTVRQFAPLAFSTKLLTSIAG